MPYTIRGYAIAGGGRRIERVDISLDGGFTWVQTNLAHVPARHVPRRAANLPASFASVSSIIAR